MDRDALESVLRRSLIETEDTQIASQMLAAMAAVAQRHRGEPFTFEPVAVELIDSLLRALYPGAGEGGEQWQAMSSSIAASLCDDASAYNRLESFWKRLSEA